MGNAPLHSGSQAKQDDPDFVAGVATIELLLKYEAEPRAVNNEGKTAGQWCRLLGMDELADYLSERVGIG
jgi:ankyrin repeat protein